MKAYVDRLISCSEFERLFQESIEYEKENPREFKGIQLAEIEMAMLSEMNRCIQIGSPEYRFSCYVMLNGKVNPDTLAELHRLGWKIRDTQAKLSNGKHQYRIIRSNEE